MLSQGPVDPLLSNLRGSSSKIEGAAGLNTQDTWPVFSCIEQPRANGESMPKIRKHLSYANVVASLALFLVVSGGAAYAASHLAKNSVGARQLKVNSVTGAKVKDGSLTGADVDASTIGQVPSAKSAASAPPTGVAGGALSGSYPNPQIASGAITAAALARGIPNGIHVVKGSSGGFSSEPLQNAEVRCPKEEKVVGGGAFAPTSGATGFVALTSSGPLESSQNSREYNGWSATAIEVNGGSTQFWGIQVYAVCAQI
jgi:hypothetical protein